MYVFVSFFFFIRCLQIYFFFAAGMAVVWMFQGYFQEFTEQQLTNMKWMARAEYSS